ADFEVKLVSIQVVETGYAAHENGGSSGYRVMESGTVHSGFHLVQNVRREDVRELHHQVGGANRLSLDCTDGVERPGDERVINIVSNVHRGSICELMVETHRSAVFADRIHARACVLVGNGITCNRLL